MPYRLLIDLQVVEFSDRMPSRLRSDLREAFGLIQQDPEGQSDAQDSDSTGRPLNIKLVGDYSITYWIDHADQHIKILDVHSADY